MPLPRLIATLLGILPILTSIAPAAAPKVLTERNLTSSLNVLGGQVLHFELTPDGTHAVMTADFDHEAVPHLYSVDLTVSPPPPPVRLTTTPLVRPEHWDIVHGHSAPWNLFWISPDSQSVFYATGDLLRRTHISGISQPQTLLDLSLLDPPPFHYPKVVRNITSSENGSTLAIATSRIYLSTIASIGEPPPLLAAPSGLHVLDLTTNFPLRPVHNVPEPLNSGVRSHALSADGSTLTIPGFDTFSLTDPNTLLHISRIPANSQNYSLSPTGTHLLYAIKPPWENHFNLFVAPTSGHTPPLQLTPTAPQTPIFHFSHDGTTIYFWSAPADSNPGFFVHDITTSMTERLTTHPSVSALTGRQTATPLGFRYFQESNCIVYAIPEWHTVIDPETARPFTGIVSTIFSVLLDDPTNAPSQLNALPVPPLEGSFPATYKPLPHEQSFRVAPDLSSLTWVEFDPLTGERFAVVTQVGTSVQPLRLTAINQSLPPNRTPVATHFTPDPEILLVFPGSPHRLTRSSATPETGEPWQITLSADRTVTRMTPQTRTSVLAPIAYIPAPDGRRLLYGSGSLEPFAYSAALHSWLTTTGPAPHPHAPLRSVPFTAQPASAITFPSHSATDVHTFLLSPDSHTVVFSADGQTPGALDLYTTSFHGESPRLRGTPLGDALGAAVPLAISDDNLLVFKRSTTTFPAPAGIWLLDLKSRANVPRYIASASYHFVAFDPKNTDPILTSEAGLFRYNLRTQLLETIARQLPLIDNFNARFTTPTLAKTIVHSQSDLPTSPDNYSISKNHLVFTNFDRLYAVPISEPQIVVSPSRFTISNSVSTFAHLPSSNTVIYDRSSAELVTLHTTNLDTSESTLLADLGKPNSNSKPLLAITADGTLAAFASAGRLTTIDLRSLVRADAPDLPGDRIYETIAFTPDSATLLATTATYSQNGNRSAPQIAAGLATPPIAFATIHSDPTVPPDGVLQPTPDSSHVIFVSGPAIYTLPLAPDSRPRALFTTNHPHFDPGAQVTSVEHPLSFSPDGSLLAFTLGATIDPSPPQPRIAPFSEQLLRRRHQLSGASAAQYLLAAPIDGSSPATLVTEAKRHNTPQPAAPRVIAHAWSADGTRLVYLSDENEADRFDITSITLDLPTTADTYDSWAADTFPTTTAATEHSLWGTSADPDQDRLPNLLEFAFATDPLAHSPPLTMSPQGIHHTLNKTLPKNLTLTLEISSDLVTWNPIEHTVTTLDAGSHLEALTSPATRPSPPYYLRLRTSFDPRILNLDP